MDIQQLKINLINIRDEVKKNVDAMTIVEQKKDFNDFINLGSRLLDFLNDDENVQTLADYEKRIKEEKESTPLDFLCKDIVDKMRIIEPLLLQEVTEFIKPNTSLLYELKHVLEQLISSNILPAFEVLKCLNGHNKTLIIIGPNGSGKTSFANYLKKAETHIKVIPACKPIKATAYISSVYNATVDLYNSEIYRGGNLNEDVLSKLIAGICTDHDNVARKYYDTKIRKDTTFEKVKRIFDDFFDVKLDNSDFGNKQIMARKDGHDPFLFNNMSDGERAAFFYIATVIVAPPKSFIIVDEPENHLNPAVYNKIWDRLIETRNDCQFIFISHTIEFINSRINFELIKIKKFVYPNYFEFDFLGDSLENLNAEHIVEIIGSRKPILFCEGTRNGKDYKIYQNLFGYKYTVIPTGNCTSVENSVDACNKHANSFSIQAAVGIVDSDLKSDDEIIQLKRKKIYTLKCNEIEMLLLDENIFKKVLEQVYKNESEFENFKEKFFKKIAERKEYIIKRLVKTKLDEKLKNSVIDDKNNKTKNEIKENLSNIFDKLDIDKFWEKCDEVIIDIITNGDYDGALKYCCLEHNEIIGGVTRPFVNDYASIALGVLKEDKKLAETIKDKYFANFEQ